MPGSPLCATRTLNTPIFTPSISSGEVRMKSLGLVIAVAWLLMTSAVSMAQGSGSYPDMRGQWKGTSEAFVSGTGPHNRSDSEPGKPRTSNQEFTLNVTR
jgi:hypothetical protein